MVNKKIQNGNTDKQIERVYQKICKEKAIENYHQKKFYNRIFSPIVLIWCMIYQRISTDHTCDKVVEKMHEGAFNHIDKSPGKKKLSERFQSNSTASYCKARKRIPIEMLEEVMEKTVSYAQCLPVNTFSWLDRKVQLLDGSTLRLRPYPELVRHYGQHKTVKKYSYWVIMRIVCLFCLQSGIVTSVSEGPLKKSENKLAKNCLSVLSPGEICIGDRGFGIFSMVQAVKNYHGEVLFRLSGLRARKLYREMLYPGADIPIVWYPSKKDKLFPDMSTNPVQGRLIYVRLEDAGKGSQDLYLFTTLLDKEKYTKERLIDLYGLRWHIELDLRHIKRTLDMQLLESKTVDLVRKELIAGMIAHNLIRLFMIMSASQQNFSVLKLSFAKCRRRVKAFLFQCWNNPILFSMELKKLLYNISKCKLPNPTRPRIEPRWVRPREKTFPEFWEPRPLARNYYIYKRFLSTVF